MGNNPHRNRLFACLAHHHRRAIIDVLRNTNSPKSTVELARDIAEETRAPSGEGVSSFESVEISLHHSHLPVLKEAGLVEYDEESRLVEPIEFTSRSGILLDVADLIVGNECYANVEARGRDDEQVTG